MTCILVASDGSEGADRAVDYAARRAKRYGAELLIVNVIDGHDLPEKVVRAFTRSQNAWLKEQLAALSTEVLTKARDHARNLGVPTVKIESRAGDVAKAILDVARERKADTIVVGKRGAGRVSRLMLGSVSQKLVLLARLPVTVVP